jgi:hypothetical protein
MTGALASESLHSQSSFLILVMATLMSFQEGIGPVEILLRFYSPRDKKD